MTQQVFNVVGTWGEVDGMHHYAFASPDEAMEFIELVEAYEQGQRAIHPAYPHTTWTILTHTLNKNAAETLAFHKSWMED